VDAYRPATENGMKNKEGITLQ